VNMHTISADKHRAIRIRPPSSMDKPGLGRARPTPRRSSLQVACRRARRPHSQDRKHEAGRACERLDLRHDVAAPAALGRKAGRSMPQVVAEPRRRAVRASGELYAGSANAMVAAGDSATVVVVRETAPTPAQAGPKAMKAFLANSAVNIVFLCTLLVSAGRLDYWPAWAYAAIGMLTNALMRLVLRAHPDLASERSKPGPGAVAWDKQLLALGAVLTFAMQVLAGLDSGRFCWSPHVSWAWSACGALLMLAGTGIFLQAMRENQFFSAVVRVQADRGHTVCDSGPYGIVRHPAYAGMIVGNLGFPLLFMSAWSAITVLLAVALMVVRTRMEDAFLEQHLEGYRNYQRATRYRLVPGIW
jgi:protein-S-isoprenylcysteine O-methyltransferase Ste14